MDGSSGESQKNNERDFLPEILLEIVRYLNAKDLSKAATVNRLWNNVATRERKQRGPERTVISFTNDSVYDGMRAKPHVTFIFASSKSRRRSEYFELDVLKKYQNRFPNYLVVTGFDVVKLDEKPITCNNELSVGGIFSLLIPEYRDLKIRSVYAQHLSDYPRFLNDFLPKDSHSPVTFILFAQYRAKNERLFELLKKSMAERQQRYTLWGGAFVAAPVVAIDGEIHESIEEEFTERNEWHTRCNGVFAMSITGSSLESWSIVISRETKEHQYLEKLLDFRGQLRFKRHTIGLVCGSDTAEVRYLSLWNQVAERYTTFDELLRAVKQIFPDVPFTGFHDELSHNYCYGLKSNVEDPEQKLQHTTSYSVIILTFD